MRLLIISLALFLTITLKVQSQSVYHHVRNNGAYEFVDELANTGIVDVNSSVKPYSRMQISLMLKQANENREKLNKRQQADLDFYLKDFGKELNPTKNFKRRFDALYFKDSLFTATLNPIGGGISFYNDSAFAYRRWVGADGWGYVGKNFGFYASLRDNAENYRLSSPLFLTQMQGGGYKPSGTGGEFSDMRGGVTWSWKWGSFGMVKDNIEWGSGYNGTNILYSRAPSFAMLKLIIKPARWFELNYIHGWLVSQVIDSTRSYLYAGAPRNVFHPKYIAANFLTFTPWRGVNMSFGNSIIYSDIEIQPAYLTPFFFYKSVDHHLNGMSNYTGQNSQMFVDFSVRKIKNTHLYLSLFLDELAMKNMFNEEKHSNFFSVKGGFRVSNFPLQNLTVTAEYTRTNPQVYEHIIETTTFVSNRFNLGHYLRENAQEYYFSLQYRPSKALKFETSYTLAQKGPVLANNQTGRLGLKFLETVVWQAEVFEAKALWQIINDGYLTLGAQFGNYTGQPTYTPTFLFGKQLTISFGLSYGF
jgi:hypothetical protein